MICKICGKDFVKTNGHMCRHLKSVHNLSLLEYGTKYNGFEVPKCPICGNYCKQKKGFVFQLTCGSDYCVQKSKERTNVIRYGSEQLFASDKIKEKIKKTNLEKYGVENPQQSEIVRNKTKKTCKEKYGYECSLQNEDVKQKISETNKLIYGAPNPFGSDLIKERLKETWKKKYGVDNPWKSNVVKENIKHTLMERYGADHPLKNSEIRNAVSRKAYERILPKYIKQFSDKFDDIHIEDDGVFGYCKKCGHKENMSSFIQRYPNGTELCFSCNPLNKAYSCSEKEIVEFIKSINSGPIVENDRKILEGKELDIFIPNMNIAFEYNGSFWHSEAAGKTKYYHLNKTEECESKDIRLFHIWEDHWKSRRDFVENRIKNLFGLLKEVSSEECEIQKVPNEVLNDFVKSNHQSCNEIEYGYGLYHDGELLEVITFVDEAETRIITNCCIKFGYNVEGGANKLLNFCIHNLESKIIITKISRDWMDDPLLEVKFDEITHTDPECFYIISNKPERISISEDMIIEDAGWKIFDSGHIVMKLNRH